MNHIDAQLARAFVRGELQPENERAWRSHASACADCRELIEDERSFQAMLGASSAPAPAVEQAVLRAEQRVRAEARMRVPVVRIAWFAAVAVLFGLVGAGAWTYIAAHRGDPRFAEIRRSLGLSAADEQRVLAHLDVALTTTRDPWLLEEYDTVVALDRLMGNEPTTPGAGEEPPEAFHAETEWANLSDERRRGALETWRVIAARPDVHAVVARTRAFERALPAEQARLRSWVALTQETLGRLSPVERRQVLTLSSRARAVRIREAIERSEQPNSPHSP